MATSRHMGQIGRVGIILLIALASQGSTLFADEIATVRLLVGRSAVVNTDWPIARLSLTNADVADALVTQPNQLLIQGKVPGTISMFVWDRAGAMTRYDVTVERDLSKLAQQIRELFPGESITVEGNGKSIVVAGTVATKYIADKAVEVAAGYVEKKDEVVSLMQVREAGPPPQVLLRVRFAEVSRSALTELGGSLFTGPDGYENFLGRTSTQQYAAPTFDNRGGSTNQLVFSDFLNLFFFDMKNQLGAVIKALQTRGLFQSLAEPNLVAESGKEASFLAGGEFPIPVAQGGGANGVAISVVFKEFGIRLNFTPTVTSTGRVRLKVRPEVSTLDFANAIVLEGFRIPALSTRRTETEIELRDGQTFAIAGLLNNTATQSMQKIPGIGDIPILGLLFRSKAAQKNQTELVVMITPEILPQNSNGVTSETPRLNEPYLAPPAQNKTFPTPPPAFTTPRPGGDAKHEGHDAGNTKDTKEMAPSSVNARPTPAEAAAVLAPRMPSGPMLMTGPLPAAAMTVTEAPAAPAASASASAPPTGSGASDGETSPKPPAGGAGGPATGTRPLTADEKNVMERSLEQERKAQRRQMRAMQEQARRDAEQAEVQKRKDQEEQKRQQQLAREQARRDAEAAEKAAKEAARQAEIDRKHQKSIDEAAGRLKAAEAAYQAELAKKGKS